MEDAE